MNPGMFVNAAVVLPPDKGVVTVPATAVEYTLYGDSVYVLVENGKDDKGNPILTAKRTFVRTGDHFADKVAILSGVKPGDKVAAAGQIKLNDGAAVSIVSTGGIPAPAQPTLN
jgi:multidrug efflux system membrane fusion protein